METSIRKPPALLSSPRSNGIQAKLWAVARHLPVALAGLCMLVPFMWMVSASLMTPQEITGSPPSLLPAHAQWQNYAHVTGVVPLFRSYLNSIVVSAGATVGVLLTSSLCGYSFAKFTYPGRDALFVLTISSLMIPPFAVVIPLFWLVKQFGWIDTYMGLIVPSIFSGYGVFMMRQFLLTFPNDLLDAARIDGASEPRIFWQVVMPLTGPALATLGAFTFVAMWNGFLWPLLIVQSQDMQTIPLALNSLRVYGAEAQSHNLQMAGTALGVIPALVLFVFLQRYFSRGIVLTGLQG